METTKRKRTIKTETYHFEDGRTIIQPKNSNSGWFIAITPEKTIEVWELSCDYSYRQWLVGDSYSTVEEAMAVAMQIDERRYMERVEKRKKSKK